MLKQIIYTIIALLISIILFEFTNIDIWLQDYFYNVQLQTWIIDRNQAVLKFILYDGIKAVFIVFILLVIGSLVFLRKNSIVKKYRKGLLIVALSTTLIPVTVGILKATTNTACPKNLTYYNGTYPHVSFLGTYPDNFKPQGKIKCFPAGHASGGFALMSLFFLFIKRRNRMIALISALAISWSIGLYKMMIGDHFLSHTIDSMIIAWLIILIIAHIVKPDYEEMKTESG